MPNQYVIYWKPENLNNLGTKMKKASSNYFKKLSVGDTVYFVTQDVEGFVLMGKIVAETVTDSREKVAESLGCKVDDLNFYEEPEWHIVANPKTAFPDEGASCRDTFGATHGEIRWQGAKNKNAIVPSQLSQPEAPYDWLCSLAR